MKNYQNNKVNKRFVDNSLGFRKQLKQSYSIIRQSQKALFLRKK